MEIYKNVSELKKNSFLTTIAIFLSRVSGLLRETILAFFFGASGTLDAFIAAFRIPSLLRDLLAEGALSNAFIPPFTHTLKTEGEKSAWQFANRLYVVILGAAGFLVCVGLLLAPLFTRWMGAGFSDEKSALTLDLVYQLFPFIFLIAGSALTMGLLNAKGHFGFPQSASAFFNLTSVLSGLLFATLFSPHLIYATMFASWNHTPLPIFLFAETARAIKGMGLGVLVGGLVQWGVQIPLLKKSGFRLQVCSPLFDNKVKKLFKTLLPTIIGGAAVQINVLINMHFASYLSDGNISYLQFAFRLIQFPIGLFGVSIATALLPSLANFISTHKIESAKKELKEATWMTLALSIASALGLLILAHPIIQLIYQHGNFTVEDTHKAALTLQGYALGLVAYALIKIYQPVFLILKDVKTPFYLALGSIVLNGAIGKILVIWYHPMAAELALGASIAAVANAVALVILLQKKLKNYEAKFYNT